MHAFYILQIFPLTFHHLLELKTSPLEWGSPTHTPYAQLVSDAGGYVHLGHTTFYILTLFLYYF